MAQPNLNLPQGSLTFFVVLYWHLLQNLSLHFFYLLHFTEVLHLFGLAGVEGGGGDELWM